MNTWFLLRDQIIFRIVVPRVGLASLVSLGSGVVAHVRHVWRHIALQSLKQK